MLPLTTDQSISLVPFGAEKSPLDRLLGKLAGMGGGGGPGTPPNREEIATPARVVLAAMEFSPSYHVCCHPAAWVAAILTHPCENLRPFCSRPLAFCSA